jgi:hypothetical protein
VLHFNNEIATIAALLTSRTMRWHYVLSLRSIGNSWQKTPSESLGVSAITPTQAGRFAQVSISLLSCSYQIRGPESQAASTLNAMLLRYSTAEVHLNSFALIDSGNEVVFSNRLLPAKYVDGRESRESISHSAEKSMIYAPAWTVKCG